MKLFLSLKMVLQQVRHEKLAFTCLCIAISATLIPLLLILGLKNGTVETLRDRLASDPANLEVKMHFSGALNSQNIREIESIQEVGFAVPCTRTLATSIMLSSEKQPQLQESNLVPTGVGDPLITRFNLPTPEGNQIILPQATAAQLQVEEGDIVVLSSTKRSGGKELKLEKACTVVGILPPESRTGVQSFVPLPIITLIEEFLDGVISSAEDHTPDSFRLKPIFYGVHLENPEVLESIRPSVLSFNNPYHEKVELTEALIQDTPRFINTRPGLLFYNTGQFSGMEKLKKLYSVLLPIGGNLSFWNPPLEISLDIESGKQAFLVHGTLEPLEFKETDAASQELILYSSLKSQEGKFLAHVKTSSEDSTLPVKIIYEESVPSETLLASALHLGMLHQARHTSVQWDSSAGVLKKSREHYARMRLYARDIDSVEPLIANLQSLGYKASGNIGGIAHVRKLNEQLQILFNLIAGIGISGAICALTLSLFNGAQRRKREYAILGTLGYPRYSLLLFPLFEAALIITCSLVISYSLFYGVSHVIQELFVDDLYPDERFCNLSETHHIWIISCSFLTGCLASLVSSMVIVKVQPSTAIREI